MTRLHATAAFLASMFLTVASPVAAQDSAPLLGPADFEGTYNETTQQVGLTWNATSTDGRVWYNVYQNGVLVASTTETNHSIAVDPGSTLVNAMHAFHVTAQYADVEGPPTPPLLFLQGPLDDYEPPRCPLIITSVQPDNPPFLFVTVDEACKDAWEWYIEYLLSETTGPTIHPGGAVETHFLSGAWG